MYANTQPHDGVIFIGVENDGKISGCKKLSTEQLNKIGMVRRYCPDARHEFKRVAVVNASGNDDFVIFLRVCYRDDKLVETTDGNAFVRSGHEKRKLTEAEKCELRTNKGEIEYELENVISLKWPEDYDIELIDQLDRRI